MSGARFEDLRGKTIVAIDGAETDSESVRIACSDGSVFRMAHSQDCCELVQIAEVIGDLRDIIDHPISLAEEVSGGAELEPCEAESFTWTFYKLVSARGQVTLRWLGESNGYYSERVCFEQIEDSSNNSKSN